MCGPFFYFCTSKFLQDEKTFYSFYNADTQLVYAFCFCPKSLS